jgi:hypothetical protein
MSTFFKQYMFQNFNDTLYIELITHTFLLTSFQMEQNIFTQKIKIKNLYSTFNIHENATLLLLILIFFKFYLFIIILGGFSNYLVLMIKTTFKH